MTFGAARRTIRTCYGQPSPFCCASRSRSVLTGQRPSDAPLDINVGLVGIGVVGSAVLDFFARGPMELATPGGELGGPNAARVRLWSAARRSRHNPHGAPEALIERTVSRDDDGRPRFFYDTDPGNQTSGRRSGGPAWREVVRDENVDIVVEVTGSPVAEALIEEALWEGKCVVTANKTVLSRTGYELVKLARSRGVVLAYEAAVGGGMPVVQTIGSSIGGRVTAILAILNGTTNFILTEMRKANAGGGAGQAAYPAAVCAAIHGGLAEADPSADVLGEDARSKIIILAGLAFGVRLRPRDVYVRGIARRGIADAPAPLGRAAYHACASGDGEPCQEVCGQDDHISTQPVFQAADLEVLDRLGYVPKLLAGAQPAPLAPTDGAGGEPDIVAWVQPAVVPTDHPLANVDGSGNACLLEVESPAREGADEPAKGYTIALQGPGAGGPETASSVVADIQFCARQLAAAGRTTRGAQTGCATGPLYMYGAGAFSRPQPYNGTPALHRQSALVLPFLLRFKGSGDLDAKAMASVLGRHGIQATPIDAAGSGDNRYFRTHPVSMKALEQGLETVLGELGPDKAPLDVLYLPVLEGARWGSGTEA